MPQHERRVIMEKAIHNSGYVVRSLEAALWAFGRSSNFEEGCLMVANLGDDADTVAAIYGQVCAWDWTETSIQLARTSRSPVLPPHACACLILKT